MSQEDFGKVFAELQDGLLKPLEGMVFFQAQVCLAGGVQPQLGDNVPV